MTWKIKKKRQSSLLILDLPAESENVLHRSLFPTLRDFYFRETGRIWTHGPDDPHFIPSPGPVRSAIGFMLNRNGQAGALVNYV